MNKFRAIIGIILFSSSVSAEECGRGNISYYLNNKKISTDEKFCFDQDERSKYIYSQDCTGLKCKILKNPEERPVSLLGYKSSIGSPGFKVCRELGGTPQIVEYKLKEHQGKIDRCIFSEKTFVSNDLLMKLWKGFVIK